MSPDDVLNELTRQGIIPTQQRDKIAEFERLKPFSLHWELRAMLYAGVLLLSGGLGLLIYENYDQIGHGILLGGIALLCAGCFAFAWQHRPPLSADAVTSRSPFGDYALVLGCLLFLALEGYAQYEYDIFGTRYGLVTFLPALLFLGLAYRFDHRGVLGMALTALVSWVGLTVRPLDFFFKTNFFDQGVVFSAILLSLVLIGAALWLERQRIKPHFTYTYLSIAGNVLLIALLAGVFNFEELRVWFVVGLAVACFGFDRYARRERSFLFLLMSAVYGYIGATYLLSFLEIDTNLVFFYFVATGVGLIAYLSRYRRYLSIKS
ncbi:MAG: DUF2157 domain-containing protein [Bacteroidetes bacterium]|nr:DUF2157 domain-containing protein [Fibrella sp.]